MALQMTPAEIDQEWRDIISGAIPSSYMQEETDWTPIYRWIADRVIPGDNILDVGCGLGHLARILLDKKCYVTGFDISNAAVIEAVKRAPEAMFLCADATAADYLVRITSFNVICFTEVLEHISKDIELVSKILPGTTVFISLPIGMEQIESPGHVRSFHNAAEAIKRYANLFDIHDWEIIDPHFYVAKMIRNSESLSHANNPIPV